MALRPEVRAPLKEACEVNFQNGDLMLRPDHKGNTISKKNEPQGVRIKIN